MIHTLVLVIVLGCIAQWAAWKLRLPAIVLFLLFGITAGPLTGWVHFPAGSESFLEAMLKVSLAIILFEGGLSLRIHELRRTGRGLQNLIILGIPIALILITLSAAWLLKLSFAVALVLGSILIVTGPTVIIPLLRQTRLSPRVSSIFKWEAIINDPIGMFIAVLAFEYYTVYEPTLGRLSIISNMLLGLLVSVSLGICAGYFVKISFDRNQVPEFLKVPMILSLIVVVYNISNLVQAEAGLIAVTVFGITLANIGLMIIHELRRFKEYMSVFLVASVFIVISSQLDLRYFSSIGGAEVLFVALVLFVIRPLMVLLSTMGTNLEPKEKFLVGWIAPRGIVAATMAKLFSVQMVAAGYEGAHLILPITFSIIFLTVVLHGFSFEPLARVLGLCSSNQNGVAIVGASRWSTEFARALYGLKIPVLLIDSSLHRLQEARYYQIPTFYGEVLSERSEERLDLGQMGFLISATDNDAYNALVCNNFAPEFERTRVFQLAMYDVSHEKRSVKRTSRGRILFAEKLRYDRLASLFFEGWRVHCLYIADEGVLERARAFKPQEAIALLVIRKGNRLEIFTTDSKPEMKVTDTLIYFAPQRRIETK